MDYIIGVDNGSTNVKAALFDRAGHLLASESSRPEVFRAEGGIVERKGEDVWHLTASTIRSVIQSAKVDPRSIVGVGLTGHGNGLYLLDEEQQVLEPTYLSTDTRAADIVHRWKTNGVNKRVWEKTLQNVWPGQPPALLAWLKEHRPETYGKVQYALSCVDFIRFRLTGSIAHEITNLSASNVLNVYEKELDIGVLELFDITEVRHAFENVLESSEPAGTVQQSAAAETGLSVGTPVVGGAFDLVSCGIASGIVDDGALCLISGTWNINEFVSTEPVTCPDIMMNSVYAIAGAYLISDASPTAASNFDWMVDNLVLDSDQTHDRGDLYERINQLVASVSPHEDTPIFFPYLYGSLDVGRSSAAIVGLRSTHSRGHILRAVYEGICFAHRFHVERLKRCARKDFEIVRVSGGLARSGPWLQMIADILQSPVETLVGDEIGCLGAAIVAAIGVGVYSSWTEASEAMVRVDRRIEPEVGLREAYDSKYADFRAIDRSDDNA